MIHKDYKLREGVNRKHMALHLLKLRGFDSTLITDAREMYDRLVGEATTARQAHVSKRTVDTGLLSQCRGTNKVVGLELSVNGTTPPEPIPETESLEPQVENPEVPAQDSTVNPPEILMESM